MTTRSCANGATTLSRMNFSGYVGNVTIFIIIIIIIYEYSLLRAV